MSIFSIKRGDDRTLELVATDPDSTPTPDEPVDLTGASLWFMVKRYRDDDDADALFSKTVGAGITVTDADGGLATVAIAAADTEDGPTGLFYWELQVRDGATKTSTLAEGRLDVRADLVRA